MTPKQTMNSKDFVIDYEELTDEEAKILDEWIHKNITPTKTILRSSSYFLKHLFQYDIEEHGFYVTNGAFKGAMLIRGFDPVNPSEMNWYYKISKKSLCFKRKLRP